MLVEDRTLSIRTDAEAQVIAEAISAFQFKNRKRKEHGLDPLDAMTIPAITMTGTRPTFFLVSVTLELSNSVITGQHPVIQTRVLRCATALTHLRRVSTGMEDTEYRKLALKRFLAFKALAKSHWGGRLDDVLPCSISSEIVIKGVNVENCLGFVKCRRWRLAPTKLMLPKDFQQVSLTAFPIISIDIRSLI